MNRYIWQKKSWPNFFWDDSLIIKNLAEARKMQGYILAQAKSLQLKDQAEILVEETMATSAIEGENLDRNGIRSSVARRLGLPIAGLPEPKRHVDGMVEILFDATAVHRLPLKNEKLFQWQAALFPTGYSGIDKISVGRWRDGSEPMRVISGKFGKTKIHYEAPPSDKVSREMKEFLKWWNGESTSLDGLIRAAVAHFWFVSIHPFDDGNGRIARAITDMALAQDEKTSLRLYSLSAQIIKERKSYYEILENTQKGEGDITSWVNWFLDMFILSIKASDKLIQKAALIGRFYSDHERVDLNERQKKVIKKMVESLPEAFIGGLTNKKYVSMTRASAATAKRDIQDLVEKKILIQNDGGGRSTSYRLNVSLHQVK